MHDITNNKDNHATTCTLKPTYSNKIKHKSVIKRTNKNKLVCNTHKTGEKMHTRVVDKINFEGTL